MTTDCSAGSGGISTGDTIERVMTVLSRYPATVTKPKHNVMILNVTGRSKYETASLAATRAP